MNDLKVARITGLFGLACVGLTFSQFPLWLVGSPPSFYGPAIVANFPPMFWFLAVSVILIRRRGATRGRSCDRRDRRCSSIVAL